MSYLPAATDSGKSTWQTNARIAQARPGQRFQPLSSGSSRNLHRGWTGAAEVQPGGWTAAGQTLVNHYTRATLFGVGEEIIDRELGRHEQHDDSSLLGAPDTERNRIRPSDRVRNEDGSMLGLPAGPRPMHERARGPLLALPAAGQTTNNDREQLALPPVGGTSVARSWVKPTRVTPMPAGPQPIKPDTTLAIGPMGDPGSMRAGTSRGPRVIPLGPGRPNSPLYRPMGSKAPSSGATPDARTAVGPGRGPAPDMPTDPAFGPRRGRRAPAGMDPRKRGTWLNYE